MSLKAAGRAVPRRRVTLEAGTAFETTFVSGKHVNLMIAHRPPGYHSRPHAHDAEQLNYVQEGEVWFFVGDRGWHLRAGDFFRVPRGAVHWMWNRTARPLVLIEAHAPSMADDPLFAAFAVRLVDAGEDGALPESASNRMVEGYDPAPVEAKYPDPDRPRRALSGRPIRVGPAGDRHERQPIASP
jgi:quercetin dioxygenase-like cupin family protein